MWLVHGASALYSTWANSAPEPGSVSSAELQARIEQMATDYHKSYAGVEEVTPNELLGKFSGPSEAPRLPIEQNKNLEGDLTPAVAQRIPIEQNKNLMDELRKRWVLVDCREAAERDVSVIEGSIDKAEFEHLLGLAESAAEAFEGRRICCYCTIGYRSGLFAKDLAIARGLDAVNMRGSLLAWVHAGGKVVLRDSGAETNRVHVYGRRWALLPEGYDAVW